MGWFDGVYINWSGGGVGGRNNSCLALGEFDRPSVEEFGEKKGYL